MGIFVIWRFLCLRIGRQKSNLRIGPSKKVFFMTDERMIL